MTIKKNKVITFRLSSEELEQFDELSRQFGLSRADAIRRSVLAALGNGPVLTAEDQDRFERFVEEFRAIGVNLNQAVRAMNSGRVPNNKAQMALLKSLGLGISALAELLLVMCAKASKAAKIVLDHDTKEGE